MSKEVLRPCTLSGSMCGDITWFTPFLFNRKSKQMCTHVSQDCPKTRAKMRCRNLLTWGSCCQLQVKLEKRRFTISRAVTGPFTTSNCVSTQHNIETFCLSAGTVIRTTTVKLLEYEKDFLCNKCRKIFAVEVRQAGVAPIRTRLGENSKENGSLQTASDYSTTFLTFLSRRTTSNSIQSADPVSVQNRIATMCETSLR